MAQTTPMDEDQSQSGAGPEPVAAEVFDAAWVIRRGTDEFTAPSLSEVVRWCEEGRVVATDLVYHPTVGRWAVAREVPQLSGCVAETPVAKSHLAASIIILSVVLVPVLAVGGCTGLVFLAGLAEAMKPTQVTVTLRANEDGGEALVKNVTHKELTNVRADMSWGRYGTMKTDLFGSLAPGEERWVSLSPTPSEPHSRPTVPEPTEDTSAKDAQLLVIGRDMQRTVMDHEFYSQRPDALRKPPTSVRLYAGDEELKIRVVNPTR